MPSSRAEMKFNVNAATEIIAESYSGSRGHRRFSNPRRQLKRLRDTAIGQAPNDAMGVLRSLIADCDLHAYNTRSAGKWWGRAYYLLGLPAAVLATIAGAAALVSTAGRIPAAFIALISAGLTTAVTFLNSNQNKQDNIKFSAAWQQLADEARLVVVEYGNMVDDFSNTKKNDFLIQQVIYLNKKKSALLRGDLSSITGQSG
jgi:hypothetical protein